MLRYSIMQPEGILIIRPHGLLSKDDFRSLSPQLDMHLTAYARRHGVLIQAKVFPGWEKFSGSRADLDFIRNHHDQIDRIAVVTDSPVGGIAELFRRHAISAQFVHFPFAKYREAFHWLKAG